MTFKKLVTNIADFVSQEQQRLSNGKPNDYSFIGKRLATSTVETDKQFRMSFRYLSYDPNPTINFLKKAQPINDEFNGTHTNSKTGTTYNVQCFNVGSRKVIKKWVVSNGNDLSLYDTKKLQSMKYKITGIYQ